MSICIKKMEENRRNGPHQESFFEIDRASGIVIVCASSGHAIKAAFEDVRTKLSEIYFAMIAKLCNDTLERENANALEEHVNTDVYIKDPSQKQRRIDQDDLYG